MSIPEIIDQEVMSHIGTFGSVKNMDPFALHILKKSQDPLMRFRRWWMRKVAVQQALDAEKRQKYISDQFKDQPKDRAKTMRRAAVIDPYYMAEMPRRHGTSWGDKDFIGSVREANPAIFPKRE